MPVPPIQTRHLERIFDPSPWSNPASYRPANDDQFDRAQRQRENLARFYRANPQFGRCSAVEGGLAPARPPLSFALASSLLLWGVIAGCYWLIASGAL